MVHAIHKPGLFKRRYKDARKHHPLSWVMPSYQSFGRNRLFSIGIIDRLIHHYELMFVNRGVKVFEYIHPVTIALFHFVVKYADPTSNVFSFHALYRGHGMVRTNN